MKDRDIIFGEIYDLNVEDYSEEGVVIKVYFLVNSFLVEIVDGIKKEINGLFVYDFDLGVNKVMISEVNEEEWVIVWKKYYYFVKILECFMIVLIWENYEKVSIDELIIEFDFGMVFGIGMYLIMVMFF